jgi:hypothetical protein
MTCLSAKDKETYTLAQREEGTICIVYFSFFEESFQALRVYYTNNKKLGIL